MKSISAGTVFILSPACSTGHAYRARLRRFSNFLRSSLRILSVKLTAVVAATMDARINIVFVVTRDVPAPTPIFRKRAWISSLRQVKLEKVEMEKSDTPSTISSENIVIYFRPVSQNFQNNTTDQTVFQTACEFHIGLYPVN